MSKVYVTKIFKMGGIEFGEEWACRGCGSVLNHRNRHRCSSCGGLLQKRVRRIH